MSRMEMPNGGEGRSESVSEVPREERQRILREVAEGLDTDEYNLDREFGIEASLPEDPVRDEAFRAAIEVRTMYEVDRIYRYARLGFGRDLTAEEEQIMLTTLEYVFKRIMRSKLQQDLRKRGEELKKQPLVNATRMDLNIVLPGGNEELTINHDLVHILLALKQGRLNDHSPIPEFMQATAEFNSGRQAMLEETYASLFTNVKDEGYDSILKKEVAGSPVEGLTVTKDLLESSFREKFLKEDGEVDQEAYEAAQKMMEDFYEKQIASYAPSVFFRVALFAQVASIGEAILSEEFEKLEVAEKMRFLEDRFRYADENMRALMTGILPEDAGEKYQKTVGITRETFERAERTFQEQPDKPFFVEELLAALKPLYEKAKNQQQTTFEHFTTLKRESSQ